MKIVLFAFSFFAAVFAGHWLLWRLWRPRRQILTLLLLFQSALAVLALLAIALPHWAVWPAGVWPWLHVVLFYEAVALAYVVAYSALEQDSPSLTIAVFVADAKGRGRTREELYNRIGPDFIIGERFESMVRSGWLAKSGEVYRLTPNGSRWARLFLGLRRLFRLPRGG